MPTIKTAFPSDSAIGRIWSDVLSKKPPNISTTDFIKDVDVGFTEDPYIVPRTYNSKGVIETEEVLEYAYRRPEFYPLLSKEGFPIPFIFTDYNPDTPYDDQLQYDLNVRADQLKAAVAKHFSSGSNDYQRELGRAIFDDTVKRFPKSHDCTIEATATEASINHCGACTESSNQLYARYLYAGLNPRILFFHDWNPSLQWLDFLSTDEEAQDHIFLGIPLMKGGMIQADPVNHVFNAQYKTSQQLSPRQYVISWLSNRISNNETAGHMTEAQNDIDLISKIAPKSTIGFIKEAEMMARQKKWKSADAALSQLEKTIPGSVEAQFLRAAIAVQRKISG